MTESTFLQELEDVLQSMAVIAVSVNRKIGVFAILGLLASASIAWLFYSTDSSLTWNIIKCGFIMLPAVVICIVWQVLAKVADAPNQLTELTAHEGLVNNLKRSGIKKPSSIRGLVSTVRAIRNEESLGEIAEAFGGIALLANPVFLFVVFVCLAILLLLIIVAPFVLIF